VELFELQPIGASFVGVYEQMQRNLQADNPTLVPQIDSRKPAIQEIFSVSFIDLSLFGSGMLAEPSSSC
jgi:hypothetical protein